MPVVEPKHFAPGLLGKLEGAARTALWLALCGLISCVVTPDPLPKADVGAPLLHIAKQFVDPLLESRIPINKGEPAIFDVRKAVEVRGTTGALHYGWYGDVAEGSGIPVVFYKACDDQPLCFLNACRGFINPKAPLHKLLLVVSDAALANDATSPVEFPAGTAFDWVEWQVELTGECIE